MCADTGQVMQLGTCLTGLAGSGLQIRGLLFQVLWLCEEASEVLTVLGLQLGHW